MSSTLRSSKTVYTRGRLFCTQGPFFRALVREEAFFAVNCAQTRVLHACVQKNIFFPATFHITRRMAAKLLTAPIRA